jgi:hypothetical protein
MFKTPTVPSALWRAAGLVITSTFSVASAGSYHNFPRLKPESADDFPFINI